MGAGKKLGYAREVDSGSWMDDFNVTLVAAAKLTNVHATKYVDNDGTVREKVTADFIDTGAITLTDYAGFPKYSVIDDYQADLIHRKVADAGTSTWKSTTDIFV
jgi:hypothetical protein